MKKLHWLTLGWAIACGPVQEAPLGEDAGMQIGTTEEALSTGEQCQTIAAAATFTGVPFAYSPVTYDPANCNKGYIVDLNNRAASEYYTGTYVSWADHQVPTTQAACEDIRLAAYVWEKPTSGSPIFLRSRSKAGVWFGGTNEIKCEVPVLRVEDFVELQDGKNYRFAVQARDHASGSYSTREVAVTNAPVWSNGAKVALTQASHGRRVAFDKPVAAPNDPAVVAVGAQDYVSILEKISGVWSHKITISIAGNLGFGSAVAVKEGALVSGHGVVVATGLPNGLQQSGSNTGQIRLYSNPTGNNWTLLQTINQFDSDWSGQLIGTSVALNTDTSTGRLGLVVGGPGNTSKKAFYYAQNANGTFPATPTITKSRSDTGFGVSVAFQYPYFFVGASSSKKVFVYKVNDSAYLQTLTTSDASTFVGYMGANTEYRTNFGRFLVPKANGLWIGGDFGVYEFTVNSGNETWTDQGRKVSVPYPGADSLTANASHLFVGDDSTLSPGGTVTSYRQAADTAWYPEERFIAKATPATGFGFAVAASDTELLVGAPTEKAIHSFALPLPCQEGPQCQRPLECEVNGDCGMPLKCSTSSQGQLGGLGGLNVCIPDGCGSSRQCSATCRCPQGGYDCDNDSECEDGFDCIQNAGDRAGVQKFISACYMTDCGDRVDTEPGATDYCSWDCPCGEGVGHCESSDECLRGLTCSGDGAQFGFAAGVDVCIPDHCKNAIQDADETGVDCGGFGCGRCDGCPLLTPGMGTEYCEANCPCEIGQGDCDADSGCRPHTTDYSTSITVQCKDNIGEFYGLNTDWEVCERSDCTRSGPTATPGDASFCTTACPCASGFGDCDTDDGTNTDCLNGLKCVTDIGPNFGLATDYDVCVPHHCANEVEDGDETDIDCGGSCGGCQLNASCSDDADCRLDLNGNGSNDLECWDGICKATHCLNDVKDWDESDEDCGGAHCNRCDEGETCNTAGDCKSGRICQSGICQLATCNDGIQNGAETDVDCGGGCTCEEAERCGPGAPCVAGLVCGQDNGGYFGRSKSYDVCWLPICEDGVDEDECGEGGECGENCSGYTPCATNADCESGEVCPEENNGPLFGLTSSVCVPTICTTAPEEHCGTTESECGFCECVPNCSGATCGQSNGCGGQCPGACSPNESCTKHSDCAAGLECHDGVCVPDICAGSGVWANCGETNSLCGECPSISPEEACSGLDCGPGLNDVSCGVCSAGSVCSSGQCIETSAVEQTSETTAAVGTLAGAFSVTDAGTAGYSIPFEIPPGRAGMQPKLGLSYNSSAGNDIAGIGWKIDGLSYITLCPRLAPEYGDLVDGGVDYRYCLDGQRLYSQPGTAEEYRTEADTLQRIWRRSGNYFEVQAPDGKKLIYGQSASASVFIDTEQGKKRTWALERIEDQAGNIIEYRYQTSKHGLAETDPTRKGTADIHPIAILYGKFDNGTVQKGNTRGIHFYYEDRPDPTSGYRNGARIDRTQRLKNVQMTVGGHTVHTYKLDYDPDAASAWSQISRIKQITECAGDEEVEVCKPPTVFTWESSVNHVEVASTTDIIVAPDEFLYVDQQLLPIDAQGDGRDGLLVYRARAGHQFSYYPAVTGAYPSFSFWSGRLDIRPDSIGDFDGDGDFELMKLTEYDDPEAQSIYVSDALAFTEVPVEGAPAIHPRTVDGLAVDVDRDGFKDFVHPFSASWFRWNAESFSFTPGGPFPGNTAQLEGASGKFVFDVDGDAREDVVYRQSLEDEWRVLQNGELFKLGFVPELASHGEGSYVRPIDINGDGLQDLVVRDTFRDQTFLGEGPVQLRLLINTGKGFVEGEDTGIALGRGQFRNTHALDVDGDGLQDLLFSAFPQWRVLPALPGNRFAADDVPLVLENFASVPANANPYSTLADVDGDGFKDFVAARGDGKLVVYRNVNATAHYLKSVTNGLGERVEVEYGSGASDVGSEGIYRRGTQSCQWPTRCLGSAGRHLVKKHSVFGGSALIGFSEYDYEDARSDFQGRGSLGFKKRTVRDFAADSTELLKTITTFDNTTYLPDYGGLYPFAGKPVEIVKVFAGSLSSLTGGLLSRTEKTELHWNYKLSDFDRPIPFVEEKRVKIGEADPDIAHILSDVLSETFEQNTIDDYGNQTSHHVETSVFQEGVVETTHITTTFPPPTQDRLERWLVSLPEERTVRSERGGEIVTRTESFDFNERGELTGVTREPNRADEDPDGNLVFNHTTIDRDDYGNVSGIIEEDSTGEVRVTEIGHDGNEIFPHNVRDASGEVTLYEFDSRFGLPKEKTDPNDLVETWVYDAFGRPMSHDTPEGVGETWSYSIALPDTGPSFAIPAVTAVNHSVNDGSFEIAKSDALGRVVRKESSGLLGATVRVDTEYDEAGRVGRLTRPYSGSTNSQGIITNHYTAAGELEGRTLADGNNVEINRASRRSLISDVVPSGLISDVAGVWIEQTIDENDNTDVRVLDHGGNVLVNVDAESNVTLFRYGAFDQVKEIEDSQGNITLIDYDIAGRMIGRDDPDAGEHNFRYTGFDEQSYHEDAESNEEFTFYDVLGRVQRRENVDGVAIWTYGEEPGTNSIGRLVSESLHNVNDLSSLDSSVEYSYESGSTGRLDTVTHTVGQNEAVVQYEYTSAGQVDLIHYPRTDILEMVVRQSYDNHGNLSSVTNATTQDVFWELEAGHQGQRVETERLGGVTTDRTYYEDTGRLATIKSTRASNVLVQDHRYIWDDAGNLHQATDWLESETRTFGYDTLNRLDSIANSGQGSGPVTYDEIGNIRSLPNVGTYEYEHPQPHAVSSAGGRTYFYDANGRMTRRLGSGITGEQHFNYTAFDLPRTVTDENDVELLRFDYSPTGTRMLKRTEAGSRFYAGELFELFTPEQLGSPTEATYKINAGGRRIADIKVSNGVTEQHYLLDDHLGSASKIVDESGIHVSEARYQPFGEPRPGSEIPETTSTGFTGHEHDTELGLINMKGRIYDPRIGRFLTPDPIVEAPFWSQGLNAYSYVFNNPLRYVDPSGYQSEMPAGAVDSLSRTSPSTAPSAETQTYYQDMIAASAAYDADKARANGDPAAAGANAPTAATTSMSRPGIDVGATLGYFAAGAVGGFAISTPLAAAASLFPSIGPGLAVLGVGATAFALASAAIEIASGEDLFTGHDLKGQDYANRVALTVGGMLGGSYGARIGTAIGESIRDGAALLARIGNVAGVGMGGGGSPKAPAPATAGRGRAPELPGGQLSEGDFPDAAVKYLGSNYREVSPGRYLSADGLRQVRYGAHEVRTPTHHHAHFEAYDRTGGRVIENTMVELVP